MAYSLAILGLAALCGVHEGAQFEGYYQRPNWLLFIFFWPPAILFCRLTWFQFVKAWRSLFANGCVQAEDGVPADGECVEIFLNEIRSHQKYIFIVAFSISCIIMLADTLSMLSFYTTDSNYQNNTTITIQHNPDFYTDIQTYYTDKKSYSQQATHPKQHNDWTTAYTFNGDRTPKSVNIIFTGIANTQQHIIVFIGLVSLLNIWAHLVYFHVFDLMRSSTAQKLRLRLDPYSTLHEFGLERWNQALNVIYWMLAVSLAIPALSKAANSSTPDDFGQVMIRWGIPLLFLSPMIFTILIRQKKAMLAWGRIRNEKDPSLIARYHQQMIWPFDRNWPSKLGILLSFAMLAYIVGDMLNAWGLTKIFGK